MPTPSHAERAIVRAPASGRVFTRWTTDDLEIAEALTANGDLQHAAALCWALMGDGRVRAALETRIKGLLRLPVSWEESGDGRSSARVVKALDGGGDYAAAHSEAALYAIGAWGTLFGVGLGQRVWKKRGARLIGVVRPYDVQFLRWDTDKRAWFVRTSTGEVQIVEGDRRWMLYAPSCSGFPDGDERPWLYGAWRACARPWLGKYFAWGDWQHSGEVHGSPIRTADIDVEKPLTPKVRDDLANSLGNVGADTAIIPPPGVKLRLLEAVANTWKMFPAAIDAASREVVIAITGQASSTEVQDGQQTGATLHGQVRQDLIDCDAQTLTTFVHDQSLEDYAAVNFGSRDLAPWTRYQTDPPADAGARGDAMKKLGDGIRSVDAVAPEGMRVDRKAAFEQAGIPLEAIPAGAAPTPPPVTVPTENTDAAPAP